MRPVNKAYPDDCQLSGCCVSWVSVLRQFEIRATNRRFFARTGQHTSPAQNRRQFLQGFNLKYDYTHICVPILFLYAALHTNRYPKSWTWSGIGRTKVILQQHAKNYVKLGCFDIQVDKLIISYPDHNSVLKCINVQYGF